jgi:hypothetical protein
MVRRVPLGHVAWRHLPLGSLARRSCGPAAVGLRAAALLRIPVFGSLGSRHLLGLLFRARHLLRELLRPGKLL